MAVLSRLRQAVNATLVTHAPDGIPLDELAQFWNMRRPHYIEPAAWRKAMLAACYGKRGTIGCVFQFLEGALAQFSQRTDVQITSSFPTRIFSSTSLFEQEHVGRFVRIPGLGIFRTIGPQTVDGSYLDLSPFKTRYWDAADFSQLPLPQQVEATILGFDLQEPTPDRRMATSSNGVKPGDPCLVRVFVFNTESLTTTPPTYIQSGQQWMMDNAGFDTASGELNIDDPDGDLATDDRVTFAAGEGGSLPTGMTEDGLYFLTDSGLGYWTVSLTLGGSVETFASSGTPPMVVTRARPLGEPYGGHLQDDVTELGNQSIGPFPLYITGDTIFRDLAAVMIEVLVAGVHVEFRRI